MKKSVITGWGSYVPEKILSNNDLEKLVETSDEWITKRTGIKERRIAADDQLTSDLAVIAAEKAIKKSGLDKNDIDLIIVATTTPDFTFPSTATIVQNKLGIDNKCPSFDMQAVCCGFVYAFSTADNYIKSGMYKNILVIAAETMSRIIDWTDRGSCILFGDGAGAFVLSATENTDRGVLSNHLHSDGSHLESLKTTGGASSSDKVGKITMAGNDIFKLAVNLISSSIEDALEHNNLTANDIDWFVPHQANLRIIKGVAKKVKLENEKVVVNIEKVGNTSAASIPIAWAEALEEGKIKQGDLVVIEALGGGLTWGSSLIKM
ncbi:MAG: ketoacyl-ACP synthase III [Alphaproteobacteria bacterium]|jgi:3-oxoacyl-[acyl-carrier-protein] synthase-3|nr:ketoacyl-ACP synthase III [Alphaproteobacteria bacterium]